MSSSSAASSESEINQQNDFTHSAKSGKDTIEIARVGPRRAIMNTDYCHWFHCVSRVCRKAWLCGIDQDTGEDYQYRKQWIVDRLALLAEAFSIEIASYAIMSNHYHLVLCVNKEKAKAWRGDEVLRRWCKVYKGPEIVQRYLAEENLMPYEVKYAESFVEEYRERLTNISWFMRSLNEPIARRINQEDDCTGHFWEGRFKVQALLDEQAILTCMAYVDLNPLRAGISKTPENSDFTSIKQRVDRQKQARSKTQKKQSNNLRAKKTEKKQAIKPRLKPFKSKDTQQEDIPFSYQDYLQLLDATARVVRKDKASMDSNLPPILQRMKIDQSAWVMTMQPGGNKFHRAIGNLASLKAYARKIKQHWVSGKGKLFGWQ